MPVKLLSDIAFFLLADALAYCSMKIVPRLFRPNRHEDGNLQGHVRAQPIQDSNDDSCRSLNFGNNAASIQRLNRPRLNHFPQEEAQTSELLRVDRANENENVMKLKSSVGKTQVMLKKPKAFKKICKRHEIAKENCKNSKPCESGKHLGLSSASKICKNHKRSLKLLNKPKSCQKNDSFETKSEGLGTSWGASNCNALNRTSACNNSKVSDDLGPLKIVSKKYKEYFPKKRSLHSKYTKSKQTKPCKKSKVTKKSYSKKLRVHLKKVTSRVLGSSSEVSKISSTTCTLISSSLLKVKKNVQKDKFESFKIIQEEILKTLSARREETNSLEPANTCKHSVKEIKENNLLKNLTCPSEVTLIKNKAKSDTPLTTKDFYNRSNLNFRSEQNIVSCISKMVSDQQDAVLKNLLTAPSQPQEISILKDPIHKFQESSYILPSSLVMNGVLAESIDNVHQNPHQFNNKYSMLPKTNDSFEYSTKNKPLFAKLFSRSNFRQTPYSIQDAPRNNFTRTTELTPLEELTQLMDSFGTKESYRKKDAETQYSSKYDLLSPPSTKLDKEAAVKEKKISMKRKASNNKEEGISCDKTPSKAKILKTEVSPSEGQARLFIQDFNDYLTKTNLEPTGQSFLENVASSQLFDDEITLDAEDASDILSIDNEAKQAWVSFRSHENCPEKWSMTDAESMEALKKLTPIWTALSKYSLSCSPYKNFLEFYKRHCRANGDMTTNSTILEFEASLLWETLDHRDRLPYILEAFICCINSGRHSMDSNIYDMDFMDQTNGKRS